MNKTIRVHSKIKKFNIIRSVRDLKLLIDRVPTDNECFKFISMGGFSTISFIKFITEFTKINKMNISTLRVGKKELKMLDILHKNNKLDKCNFVIGSLMANDSKKVKGYNYYTDFQAVCKTNNWTYSAVSNHSKIILFDTEIGKFVIETSSNLNENPKFEQFSFEKDEELYEFYIEFFEELGKRGEGDVTDDETREIHPGVNKRVKSKRSL